MNSLAAQYIVGLIISIAILGYLVYTLMKPEEF
jgi:K+-transporting ATPase KdpF subunit